MGRKPSVDLTDAELSGAGEVIGTFDCSYRGSAPVRAPRGDELAGDAVRRVSQLNQPARKVALVITTEGVYVKDRTTGQTITNVELGHLSYVSCLGRDQRVLCYFHADPRLDIISCHVFSVKKGSTEIPKAINRAFQAHAGKRRGSTSSEAWADADAAKAGQAGSTPIPPPTGKMPPQIFKAKYLGHTTVDQDSGEVVAEEALVTILKDNSGPPANVHVVVDGEKIQILRQGTSEVLQNALVSEVSFCGVATSNKKVFQFITKDKEQVMFCHALQMKKKTRLLNAAIAAAFVVAEEAQKREAAQQKRQSSSQTAAFARQVTSKTKERQTNAPLGIFEAQYLGSWAVDSGRGADVVAGAATQLLATKPEPTVVALVISGEGLKCVEALTSELVSNTFIKNISFTTVVDDKKILKLAASKGRPAEELFVFINHNESLNRYTCEIFKAGRRGREICQSINVAFQVAIEAHKKQKGNPFTAVSAKRDPVKGPLFRRQIHRRDMAPLRVIGMGQFGEVYLAQQSVRAGTGENGGNTVRRAVKLLRNAASAADKEEFLREAETMIKFSHPNLVRLVGVAVQQRPWLCVLEFLKYGDIRTVMKCCKDKGVELTRLEMYKFAIQIAAGMAYLAAKGFVHMDLAARNCLLHERNQVRVGDFGLTRPIPEGQKVYTLQTTLKLPIKWMSIESMDQKVFSEKSDVWAFAVTIWEVFSYGETPYTGIKNMEVQDRVRGGYRLACPDGCDPDFHKAVALPCWNPSPRKRPTFEETRLRILDFANKERQAQPTIRDVGGLIAIKEKQKFQEFPVADDLDFTPEGRVQVQEIGVALTPKASRPASRAGSSSEEPPANPFLSAAAQNKDKGEGAGDAATPAAAKEPQKETQEQTRPQDTKGEAEPEAKKDRPADKPAPVAKTNGTTQPAEQTNGHPRSNGNGNGTSKGKENGGPRANEADEAANKANFPTSHAKAPRIIHINGLALMEGNELEA